MKQIEFDKTEKLAMENLRLKIQMAELQKQQAITQLNVFTQDLLRKYEVPEGTKIQVTEAGILVLAEGSETPDPPAALSQAQVQAKADGKDSKAA